MVRFLDRLCLDDYHTTLLVRVVWHYEGLCQSLTSGSHDACQLHRVNADDVIVRVVIVTAIVIDELKFKQLFALEEKVNIDRFLEIGIQVVLLELSSTNFKPKVRVVLGAFRDDADGV